MSVSFELSCIDDTIMILDANSMIWTFRRWDRPLRLVSPSLDCSSPKTTPVQIGCSDYECVILTKSGDMYVWEPFMGTFETRYREGLAELEKEESTKAVIPDDRTVIPCRTLEIDWDPVKVPVLPDLPDLPGTGLSEEECKKETKLIKIALDGCLVGLTNKGHVLKLDGMNHKGSFQAWRYVSKSGRMILHLFLNCDTQLPNFSEIDKVKEHSAFHATTGDNGEGRPPEVELLSDTMLITDVSHIASISPGFPI